MKAGRFVAPATLARMLDVSTRTVTRWCRQGRIEGAKHAGYDGAWRIPVEELEHLGVSEMSETGRDAVPNASVKS